MVLGDAGRGDVEGQAKAPEKGRAIRRSGCEDEQLGHGISALKTRICAGKFFDTPTGAHYDTAPMPRASKEPLDALNLAAAASVVEREFRLADLPRLLDRLAAPDGTAQARLALHSAGGVPTGELAVRAEALLTCQRCLRPMRQALESKSQLAFVEREDSPVPADHEVITGDPRRVDLALLVEDELLLSLPLIPKHDDGDECAAREPPPTGDAGAGPPGQEMRRPFAGLKELLKH